jgi:hypothetical protein
MKHLVNFTTYNLHNESILLPTDLSNKTFFHGCPVQLKGEQMAEDGFLKPGMLKNSSRSLTPIAGKVYITPNLEESVIYALNGSFIGSTSPLDRLDKKQGQYGYVAVFTGKQLSNVIPDEDFVGSVLYHLLNGDIDVQYMKNYQKVRYENVQNWSDEMKNKFLHLARYIYTPDRLEELKNYDDFADLARAGKTLISNMSVELMDAFIKSGCSLANQGNIMIKKLYKFDKSLRSQLKPDCSNFYKLAERIK